MTDSVEGVVQVKRLKKRALSTMFQSACFIQDSTRCFVYVPLPVGAFLVSRVRAEEVSVFVTSECERITYNQSLEAK